MPITEIHVPLYDKLPDTLFNGAYELWLAPGGEREVGRMYGYYFHDHTHWADARHLLGWSREIINTLKPDSIVDRLFSKTSPKLNWLCGHGFQLKTNQYQLCGSSLLYSYDQMVQMAQKAQDDLAAAEITRDQWGGGEQRHYLSAIQTHMMSGAHAFNPWVQDHIRENGHLASFVKHQNHCNLIHHDRYPIRGPLNASGIGQTHCNSLLNADFQNGSYTGPATIYSALFSLVPSDTGVGTEAAYSGYARQAITCNSSNFPAASAGAITYGVVIGFPTNTGSSETEVATAWMAASSGGAQPLYWGNLSSNVTVSNGIAPQFNANAVTTSGI